METIMKLQSVIGGRWYGVSIIKDEGQVEGEFKWTEADRFCEAIQRAGTQSVYLNPDGFTCLGARYSFGIGNGIEDEMIRTLAEKRGYTLEQARKLIEATPRLEEKPYAVGLNTGGKPEVAISRLQPERVMKLIERYQKKEDKIFESRLSCVLSACGNVTVKALQTGDLAVSFGCEDARNSSGLSRDMLFVGMPYSLAKKIVE